MAIPTVDTNSYRIHPAGGGAPRTETLCSDSEYAKEQTREFHRDFGLTFVLRDYRGVEIYRYPETGV